MRRPFNAGSFIVAVLIGLAGTNFAWPVLAADGHNGIAIEPKPLSAALSEFASRTGLQIVYRTELGEGILSKGAGAGLSVEETLQQLLRDTGLVFEFINARTVAIRGAEGRTGNVERRASRQWVEGGEAGIRVAQQGDEERKSQSGVEGDEAENSRDSDTASADVKLEEVVVTGTQIRGVSDQFSPVKTITREEIDRAGLANVADILMSLPQNYGGDDAGSPDATTGPTRVGPGASSANLRGLGNDSTLILVNGRRFATGGESGNIVDISSIPVTAIERVEVLAEGASAIYGADAIAGVINFILKKDFEGAETRARFGSITRGDGDERVLGQTFGHRWTRARALLSYEYNASDSLDANDKSFTRAKSDPSELLPRTRRHSTLLSSGVALTPDWDLSLDAYYNDRHSTSTATSFGDTYFMGSQSKYSGAALATNLKLRGDWQLDVSGTFSRGRTLINQDSFDVASGAQNGDIHGNADSDVRTYEVKVSGPVALDLGGGNLKLALGAQRRRETFDGLRVDPSRGITFLDVETERTVEAGFAEAYLPLVTEKNAVWGLNHAALTMAARYERYSDVGTATSPKVGLVVSPMAGLNLRATYGKSFRAANLSQMVDSIDSIFLINYQDPSLPGGQALALQFGGTSLMVKPERATNLTAGFDLTPTFLPAAELRATYFDIDFKDRIRFPSISYNPAAGAYFNSAGPVIPNVTQAQIAALLARTSAFFSDVPGAVATDATIFVDSRFLNIAQTRMQGVDYSLSYRLPLSRAQTTLSVDGTYLLTYRQKVSPLVASISVLNTSFNPTSHRMRGGASTTLGDLTLAGYLNYTGDYDDTRFGTPRRVASWTTLDFSASYTFSAPALNLLKGASVIVAARNLFERNPPRFAPIKGGFYDPYNADPQGRFVSVQLTKPW